jgi:glutamate-1-semialdehyde 2,1-aminomutase
MRAVGLDEPIFMRSGSGSTIEDVDGNRYVDWVMSWGPLIFGHADAETLAAIEAAARRGTTFGAPTEAEVELAAEIVDAVPSVELVRLVSSGTEASLSAIRLARGFTRRDRILKFAGCYHGHVDALLASAGSGLATLGIPSSPGVPTGVTADTVVTTFNDVDAAAAAVERYGEGLAAIVVEPVAGNMGVVPPAPGFLEALRRVCDRTGALLVFDEVMTGFRVAFGGATEAFGVTPDLVTLGKVVGGGLPVAAYGGRAALMQHVAPVGRMYQAGTLSGNPLAMAGGLATLSALTREVHDGIVARTATLVDGMRTIAERHGVPCTAGHTGSMWGFFFHPGPVRSFDDAKASDVALFRRFFHAALDRGVYLAPSAFEAGFTSAAHGDAEIASTLERLDAALGAALDAGA